VTNPGSGFERRSSLAARSAFGIRDELERETVTDANANLSRMRTRTCHGCERGPVTLRDERHESVASLVRSTR
jgi:hypothetical protein